MLFLNKDRVLKVLVHECKIAVKNFVRKSNEMFRLSNDVLYDESTGQVGWSVKCIGGDVNVVVGLGERYPMDGMKLLSVSWPSGYLADESSRIKAIEQELEKSGWTVEKLLRSDLFQ